jgi:hypothetical protein
MYIAAANQTLGSDGALTMAKVSKAYAESTTQPWLIAAMGVLLGLEIIGILVGMMAMRSRYRGRIRLMNNNRNAKC